MYDLVLVASLAVLAAASGAALWRLRQAVRDAARLPEQQARVRRTLDEARAALAEASALPRPAPPDASPLDARLDAALADVHGALLAPDESAPRPDPVRPDAGRRRTRPPHASSPRLR